METNYLICSGEACPLRMTCERHQSWLNNEDNEAEEMIPDYHNGACHAYERKEYYYGG